MWGALPGGASVVVEFPYLSVSRILTYTPVGVFVRASHSMDVPVIFEDIIFKNRKKYKDEHANYLQFSLKE